MMRATGVVLALLLAGCASAPRVAVEKEKVECSIEPAAVAQVKAPAPLRDGATNEDLRNREQALQGALEKANGRLAAIPGLVNTKPGKAAEQPQGLWARVRSWF